MSHSTRPKASAKVQMNWLMPAQRQSCRSFCTSGEGGGAGPGATTVGGRTLRGMSVSQALFSGGMEVELKTTRSE